MTHKTLALGLLLILLLTMALAPAVATASPEIIYISSDIDGDTIWSADHIYVVDNDVTVIQGVTLKIDAGTIVKFAQYADLTVRGALQVNELPPVYYVYVPLLLKRYDAASGPVGGPPPLPLAVPTVPPPDPLVVLTSLSDDSAGGDTNEDGDATTPATGDWGGIAFEEGSDDANSYMRRFAIRYGGRSTSGLQRGAILLENASPSLLREGQFSDNYLNGIEIQRSNWQTDRWSLTDIAYHITGDVTVPRANTLSIDPGVVLKFAAGKQLKVLGTLQAVGAPGRPVLMTSIVDDTALGDTNGDGDATAPDVKDWGGILFDEDSQANPGTLDYVEMRYTGQSIYPNVAAIELDNCSPSMRNVVFVNNYRNGALLKAYSAQLATLELASPDVPYWIKEDLYVPRSEVLTIGPGANLKFERNASLHVAGVLQAVGTQEQPIVMTSIKDDSALGDTNNDQQRSSPNAGDWGCVFFDDQSDDSRCHLEWVEIRHGGRDGLDFSSRIGGIRLDNASPTLNNIVFLDNELNAVEIPKGDWNTDTWDNTGVVYFVSGDLRIPSGQTLTVAPGVIVKVLDPITVQTPPEITVEGALRAGDTSGQATAFTSGQDDNSGPAGASNWDTNNDATATAPAIKDWVGITFAATADGANSYFGNVNLMYGGIRKGTFTDPHAVLRLYTVGFVVEGCRFTENYRCIEALSGAQPTVSWCSFEDNENYAIYNDTPSNTVQATSCWWGALNGPRSDGEPGNPAAGDGDMVSTGVNFTPWLTVSP